MVVISPSNRNVNTSMVDDVQGLCVMYHGGSWGTRITVEWWDMPEEKEDGASFSGAVMFLEMQT